MLKISEFSKQSSFSIRMLRYLEEQGLLVATRKDNNYRFYNKNQLGDAQEIKDLQNIGFQLKEIIELKKDSSPDFHIIKLRNVLEREVDIAEVKSNTIPKLKALISTLEKGCGKTDLFSVLHNTPTLNREVPIRSEKTDLQRVAYNIPFLQELYEDYLEEDSKIELITTNIIYFKDIASSANPYQVYTILDKSSFMFGLNLSDYFIHSYLKSWKKFIPTFNLEQLEDFTSTDISSLMGDYDMVIQTKFKYKDNLEDGEITIPYTPIYTMSKFGLLK